jgi:hypothetical protein
MPLLGGIFSANLTHMSSDWIENGGLHPPHPLLVGFFDSLGRSFGGAFIFRSFLRFKKKKKPQSWQDRDKSFIINLSSGRPA